MKSHLLNMRLKILLMVMQSQQSSSVEIEAYRWSRLLVVYQRTRDLMFILIQCHNITNAYLRNTTPPICGLIMEIF